MMWCMDGKFDGYQMKGGRWWFGVIRDQKDMSTYMYIIDLDTKYIYEHWIHPIQKRIRSHFDSFNVYTLKCIEK